MNYYLHYHIGPVSFATPIEEVKEITRPKNLFTEDKTPENIAGFFDLRGKKICLFDLPKFLKIKIDTAFEIIVATVNQNDIGVKVEKIFGIVAADDIIPYPEIIQVKNYFKGVVKQDNQILQVISFTKLLSGPRLNAIKNYLA